MEKLWKERKKFGCIKFAVLWKYCNGVILKVVRNGDLEFRRKGTFGDVELFVDKLW